MSNNGPNRTINIIAPYFVAMLYIRHESQWRLRLGAILTKLVQYAYGYKISTRFNNGSHRTMKIRVIVPF